MVMLRLLLKYTLVTVKLCVTLAMKPKQSLATCIVFISEWREGPAKHWDEAAYTV